MDQMTAVQKLVRLAELGREISKARKELRMGDVSLLVAQREELYASVEQPPAELIGNPDPKAWSQAAADYFATITPETAYAWFSHAMLAAYSQGQQEQRMVSFKVAQQDVAEGVKGLADVLAFIRAGADAGKIRCGFLIDPLAAPGSYAVSLSEMITDRLTRAGLE
jgi:hypothetical protein